MERKDIRKEVISLNKTLFYFDQLTFQHQQITYLRYFSGSHILNI